MYFIRDGSQSFYMMIGADLSRLTLMIIGVFLTLNSFRPIGVLNPAFDDASSPIFLSQRVARHLDIQGMFRKKNRGICSVQSLQPFFFLRLLGVDLEV